MGGALGTPAEGSCESRLVPMSDVGATSNFLRLECGQLAKLLGPVPRFAGHALREGMDVGGDRVARLAAYVVD